MNGIERSMETRCGCEKEMQMIGHDHKFAQ